MIFCGNDIIRISRVQESIDKLGENFLNRVYTEEEMKYCESRKVSKYQSYAARFAAKEAAYKAIAPDTSYDVEWKNIEVKRNSNGKPFLVFYGKLKEIIEQKGIKEFDLSLSHDGDYAIATVIAQSEK